VSDFNTPIDRNIVVAMGAYHVDFRPVDVGKYIFSVFIQVIRVVVRLKEPPAPVSQVEQFLYQGS